MAMPRPPQLDSAFQQVSAVLAQVEGKPVDLVKDSWADIEKGVIKLLGGPFDPLQPEHQVIALGLAAAMGERLHAEYQAFWFPYRETPEGASLGFPEALIMLAPFGAVVDALASGKLEKVDEVTKSIRTSLAQAKFGAGGGAAACAWAPRTTCGSSTPASCRWSASTRAKLKQAWDLGAREAHHRSARRDQPRPPAAPGAQEAARAAAARRAAAASRAASRSSPRPAARRGWSRRWACSSRSTTNTGPAAEEFWQEVVMPLLFVGAPASFPPLDDEELAAAKQGIDPLFLFLDVVPFQFKASEEALLGAFPDLQVPAPEFRGSTQVRLIKVGTDSVKEALAAFDPQKTRDAIKRFGEHLKEKGGVAAARSPGRAGGEDHARRRHDPADRPEAGGGRGPRSLRAAHDRGRGRLRARARAGAPGALGPAHHPLALSR